MNWYDKIKLSGQIFPTGVQDFVSTLVDKFNCRVDVPMNNQGRMLFPAHFKVYGPDNSVATLATPHGGGRGEFSRGSIGNTLRFLNIDKNDYLRLFKGKGKKKRR